MIPRAIRPKKAIGTHLAVNFEAFGTGGVYLELASAVRPTPWEWVAGRVPFGVTRPPDGRRLPPDALDFVLAWLARLADGFFVMPRP
jgi:hypothetical protein